jgi:hypothetical protein
MVNEWGVLLSVPFDNMDEWRLINNVASSINAHENGAGTGCGYRDIDWYVEGARAARVLAVKLGIAFHKLGFRDFAIWIDKEVE